MLLSIHWTARYNAGYNFPYEENLNNYSTKKN